MSKLIINKHQICYIPEYNLYLQRVGVDNTSVRHTCERICSIYQICRDGYCRNKTLVRDDKAETVKYTGVLDQSQLEHVIIFIQDGRSSSDIKDLIEHYENENAKVDDLIGDPIFIEG